MNNEYNPSTEELENEFSELFDPDDLQDIDDNIIILSDEDGNDIRFEFIDLINYNGEEYVVLLPADDEEADEVVILKLDESGEDGETYSAIDDNELLMTLFNIFKAKFKNEFNFID